jgi:hypothetical protein
MDRRESTASQETFISLQQLDPSPIESPEYELNKQLPDLPAASPPARSSTLGLSGSGHSSVYYRTLSTLWQKCSNPFSNPSAKILLLCLHSLRRNPHHQHFHYPPHHSLCSRLGTLSTPYKALLSILSLRASSYNPPNCNPYPLRPCSTNTSAQRKPRPVRRIHNLCLFPA